MHEHENPYNKVYRDLEYAHSRVINIFKMWTIKKQTYHFTHK